MTHRKKRTWALSPEQQALVTTALAHFVRWGDEVDDRDVVEDQMLKWQASRTRIYDQELIGYAEESRSDLRAPGRWEQVRRLRDQDAHSALSRRINRRGGNPPRYNKDAIRQEVRRRMNEAKPKEKPKLDWKILTRVVAASVEPIRSDTAKDVLRAVRRYCRDLR